MNIQQRFIMGDGSGVIGRDQNIYICSLPVAPIRPPSISDKAQEVWLAYWPYIVVTIVCCGLFLLLRTTGQTDMTQPLPPIEYDRYDEHEHGDEDDD